jgi:hypothetical protein
MANKRISSLGSLGGTPAVGDIIPITDISDTAGSAQGTTKKVTVANLVAAAPVQSVAGRTGTVTLSSSDVSGLGTAAVANTGVASGNVVLLDSTGLPPVDGSQLTGIQVTDESLRGTANPHIGAFPNQSFLVVDNPSKSVMLGSDADGKIYIFNSSGKSAISTGISAVEDSAEPDIEITTTTGTYSLISGDSDAKDPNGLPIQQGFNAPNIGAFSAPLLISGGSIV